VNAVQAFLLAFPALFSIVNPPGAAIIFNEVTSGLSHDDRRRIAGKVGLYSAIVMLVSLWGGATVLSFFGISLAALRIGGGAVVALRAYEMLIAPERNEARKTEQAGPGADVMDSMAFFPLTMPFTTGPGTIAVAVALGAAGPSDTTDLLLYFAGVSAAVLVIALMVWVFYRAADQVSLWIGDAARRSLARLTAFLLLCIGIQILLTGIEGEVQRYITAMH
jgi:multiple antibiotic resistance protein